VCAADLSNCEQQNFHPLPFLATFSSVVDPDPVGSPAPAHPCVAETLIGCKDKGRKKHDKKTPQQIYMASKKKTFFVAYKQKRENW
jgi:hypothetical protein